MADSTITTAQGDTWDTIAKTIWGDEKRMDKLLEANPDVQEVVFFSAGVVLNVPDIPAPTTVLPLPPWRKAS